MSNVGSAAPLLKALGISDEFVAENDHILEDPVVKAFVNKEITLLQALWIEHYISNGMKAELAVKQAGYEAGAYELRRAQARRLQTNPKIRRIISQKVGEVGLTSQEVIAHYADIATASMGDFISLDPETNEIRLDLKKAKDRSRMHLVKKFRVDERGRITIEMRDQDHALDMLAKYHGLMEKDNLQKLSPEAAIIASMNSEERKKALESMRSNLDWKDGEFDDGDSV